MKTKDKVISIIAILAIFFWMIFLIKSVLTPFVTSLVIAYFLNPLVNHLNQKYKLSRLAATSLILGLFIAALATIFLALLPIIFSQLVALLEALPKYFQIIADDFYPKIATFLNKFGFGIEANFSQLFADEHFNSQLIDFSKNIFQNTLNSSASLINILSLVFITPILIFYLLKDWDILTKKINDYLPRAISNSVKKIANDIDGVLSGYVRGQFNVCLILAIIYSVMLSFAGLNFGFLIGLLTGFFSFIPYLGMLCGVTAAIVFALLQWGFDFSQISVVALVFIFGQIVESNFLTPKLIGSKVGLHPVWMIFGLFVFGTLFGFVGVLIAVPLTAVCGVITKHFALEYKKRFA